MRPVSALPINFPIAGWLRALLNQAGIKSKPTTAKNPQANAVCERMHKTVADVLRTLAKEKPPSDDEEAEECMDNAMGSCIHAL